MKLPLSGSCQCGAITYTVDAEPLFTYACHCSSCQKRTGSAFSLGLAKLQAGTLEDTSEVEPEVHMWTVRKQPWVTLSSRARQFETQPEDTLALLQAALDYRAQA